MSDIRKHMQEEHNTPTPIVNALNEDQLVEWDQELHENED